MLGAPLAPRRGLLTALLFSVLAGAVVPIVGCGAAEPEMLPRGTVIERVVCRGDAAQSYALYLPTSLDRSRPAPVIFCFEPSARGRLPVERFQAGAEQFGYIVAGSNNSRNGPFEPQRIAVEAMLNDVLERFVVDRKRIVLTGMSGGARLATAVAEETGLAQAVIACGAGFPRGQEPGEVGYAYVGVAGIDDFNTCEMRLTDATLAELGARHRLLTFAGGHEWPPADVASVALAWLELQAMRTGEREKDEAFIDEFLARGVAAAATLAPADRLREWRALVADGTGLADVTKLRVQIDELAQTPEGAAVAATERAEETGQEQAMAELIRLAREGKYPAVRQLAAKWRKAAEAATDSSARRIARRVNGDAATYGREGGQEALALQLFADAVNLFELCAAFRPDRAPVFVDLARAYAGDGRRKPALAALHEAVSHGFSEAARIENAAEFAALRDDAAFQALLAALRKNGDR